MNTDYNDFPKYTITGNSYEKCKEKLQEKYGDDFLILAKRTILEGGFLGFFQKEMMEVTYSFRPREMQRPKKMLSPYGDMNTLSVGKADDFQQKRDELLRSTGVSVDSVKQMAAVKQSVEELKNLVNEKLELAVAGGPSKHPSIQKIEDLLEKNEFTFSYISEISKRMNSDFSLEQLDDFDYVERQVVDWIGESIVIQTKKTFRPPHVIVLVGPTGVGKTTTLAKLAANMIFDAHQKGLSRPEMRFISIDKLRVAAMEQLVHYGEVMSIPVDKAESFSDVKTIYSEYRDRVDAIFIDTSGFSPNDSSSIGKMRSILDIDNLHADVYLVVSATTKARDIANIIQNYEPFAFESVIVSKCDETKQYGNIISVLHEKRKSLSYITDGQRIQQNIHPADVVSFLMRLNDFKIDRVHIEDKFGVK